MPSQSSRLFILGAVCLAAVVAAPVSAAPAPPVAPVAAEVPEAVSINRAFTLASEAEREHWRKSLAAIPRPGRGCFHAEFPDTQWRAVECDYSKRKLRLPKGGGGARLETVGGTNGDETASVTGGITQAEGSFDSVSTTGAKDSIAGSGKYSLQINTEFFDTSVCSGAGAGSTCKGWEQFVFDYDGSTSMQYWLIDYGPPNYTCPTPRGASCDGTSVYTDGWCAFALYGRTYCAVNSPTVSAKAVSPSALANVKLQGNAAVGSATSDSFTSSVSGSAASVTGGNYFSDLSSKWHEAEFNVFGYGSSSEVEFNPNTTIVARVGVDSGVNVGPGCDFQSYTAETNNLSIITTSSTPLHDGHPSLVFTESNTGTADPSCSAAISIGDTHVTTFDGVHYDFQASGEFLLAEIADEFTVQARQASGAPQWPNAAVNKAIAVSMGATRVVFYVAPSRILVDGEARAIEEGRTLSLADAVQLRRQGSIYTLSDTHGNRVRVTLNSNWIDTAVLVGSAPSRVRGLLGNPAGDGKSLATSAGARIAAPIAFSDLYGVFASGWRVQEERSLFASEGRPAFGTPSRPFFAPQLPAAVAARARTVCTAAGVKDKDQLQDCMLDVSVLNEKSAARPFVFKPRLVRTLVKPVFAATKAP